MKIELTKAMILDSNMGFINKDPLLIKKTKDFRLTLFQTKGKSECGYKQNEFEVKLLKPHGKEQKIADIKYLHELHKIVANFCDYS